MSECACAHATQNRDELIGGVAEAHRAVLGLAEHHSTRSHRAPFDAISATVSWLSDPDPVPFGIYDDMADIGKTLFLTGRHRTVAGLIDPDVLSDAVDSRRPISPDRIGWSIEMGWTRPDRQRRIVAAIGDASLAVFQYAASDWDLLEGLVPATSDDHRAGTGWVETVRKTVVGRWPSIWHPKIPSEVAGQMNRSIERLAHWPRVACALDRLVADGDPAVIEASFHIHEPRDHPRLGIFTPNGGSCPAGNELQPTG